MTGGISVVITTYNREEDCKRAVNSVLAQSASLAVEIVIVMMAPETSMTLIGLRKRAVTI